MLAVRNIMPAVKRIFYALDTVCFSDLKDLRRCVRLAGGGGGEASLVTSVKRG